MELRKLRACFFVAMAFIALAGVVMPPAIGTSFGAELAALKADDPRLVPVNAAARIRDYTQMFILLKPLAVEGNPEAMYQLSGLYRSGRGVDKDVYRAYEWMEKAAAKGHKKALASLGAMQKKCWDKPRPKLGEDAEKGERAWYFKDSEPKKEGGAGAAGMNLGQAGKVPEDGLRWAARKGQLEKVQFYVKAGVDINDAGANGRTALMEAASFAHAEVVDFLLQNRARHDMRDRYGNDALLAAVNNGKAEKLSSTIYHLIDSGADINSLDSLGNTPLLLAAGKGLLELVDILLDSNADIYVRNKKGKTAVEMAYLRDHAEIVQMLLRHGAKLPKPVKDATKPPVILAEDLQTPPLIKKMAGKEIVPTKGWSTLMIASWRGNVPVVAALVAKGVELNWQDEEGHTALSRAAWQGHIEVVDLLLNAGANKEIRQKNGMTALSWAAQEGKLVTVKMLIAAGARVNLRHKDGNTPLFLAVNEGHPQTTAAMLKAGCKCNVKRKDGLTPLILAVRDNQVNIVTALLGYGADVNALGPGGRSPLWYAAARGNLAIVKMIVGHNANTNLADIDGQTPLFMAAGTGRVKIVKILLGAGASAIKASNFGNTPLMMAAIGGHNKIVELLVGEYPKIDLKNLNGDTALILAVGAGHVKTAGILLAAGAGPYKKNMHKESAHQLAAGNQDMLAVLEKYGVKSKLRKIFRLPAK